MASVRLARGKFRRSHGTALVHPSTPRHEGRSRVGRCGAGAFGEPLRGRAILVLLVLLLRGRCFRWGSQLRRCCCRRWRLLALRLASQHHREGALSRAPSSRWSEKPSKAGWLRLLSLFFGQGGSNVWRPLHDMASSWAELFLSCGSVWKLWRHGDGWERLASDWDRGGWSRTSLGRLLLKLDVIIVGKVAATWRLWCFWSSGSFGSTAPKQSRRGSGKIWIFQRCHEGCMIEGGRHLWTGNSQL
mmetsp:Transcript_19708/g.42219  ORF Transcript_19708/g.42219 Transcript_19708/m.42219 type:complete len:245 (-) Transcript_19708:211-945(-)